MVSTKKTHRKLIKISTFTKHAFGTTLHLSELPGELQYKHKFSKLPIPPCLSHAIHANFS